MEGFNPELSLSAAWKALSSKHNDLCPVEMPGNDLIFLHRSEKQEWNEWNQNGLRNLGVGYWVTCAQVEVPGKDVSRGVLYKENQLGES